MKNTKRFINTKKGKIIILSSITFIMLIIIIGIVVDIMVGMNIKNNNHTNDNNNTNSKNIIINQRELTPVIKPVRKKEYQGQFKSSDGGRTAIIDLNSLTIPNSQQNLKGKSLTVTKGTISGIGGTSNEFSGNLLTLIQIVVTGKNVPRGKFTFTIQENSQKDIITLTFTEREKMTQNPYFDLPLS